MKRVALDDFRKPATHEDVESVVFRGETDGSRFDLGFLPEAEFIYHFDIAPDVFFQDLPIQEVYYEPYRTFLRLKSPVRIQIHWPGASDKLFVKGNYKG